MPVAKMLTGDQIDADYAHTDPRPLNSNQPSRLSFRSGRARDPFNNAGRETERSRLVRVRPARCTPGPPERRALRERHAAREVFQPRVSVRGCHRDGRRPRTRSGRGVTAQVSSGTDVEPVRDVGLHVAPLPCRFGRYGRSGQHGPSRPCSMRAAGTSCPLWTLDAKPELDTAEFPKVTRRSPTDGWVKASHTSWLPLPMPPAMTASCWPGRRRAWPPTRPQRGTDCRQPFLTAGRSAFSCSSRGASMYRLYFRVPFGGPSRKAGRFRLMYSFPVRQTPRRSCFRGRRCDLVGWTAHGGLGGTRDAVSRRAASGAVPCPAFAGLRCG
jgi:hypothetical protein